MLDITSKGQTYSNQIAMAVLVESLHQVDLRLFLHAWRSCHAAQEVNAQWIAHVYIVIFGGMHLLQEVRLVFMNDRCFLAEKIDTILIICCIFDFFFFGRRSRIFKEINVMWLRDCLFYLYVGGLVLVVGVQFRIIPGNSSGLDIDFVLEGGQLSLYVRQVEPNYLPLATVLEPEEIGALEREGFVDMRQSQTGFVIRHSEDVGALRIVLIFRHVVVDKSHLFLRHRTQ